MERKVPLRTPRQAEAFQNPKSKQMLRVGLGVG